MTADGEGDGLCASVRIGRGGALQPELATVDAAHSVGLMYSMITFLQGMVPYEHEYKLMGLAPYAPDQGAQRSYEQFRDLFTFTADGLGWHRSPRVPNMFYSDRFFERRLRRHRFDWVAAGLQRYTVEHMTEWIRRAVVTTGVRRVALSGGVFMNVKVNKRVAELHEVDDLFVFPSCGDETNAMGAAFHVYAVNASAAAPVSALGPLYWGPQPAGPELPAVLQRLRSEGYSVSEPDDVELATAELLAAGEIVARARGPMEFGARALGNRSILADPTRPDAVRTINDMIKSRDFWMPFAPAIRFEDREQYLVNPRDLAAPYMIMAFDTTSRRDELRAAIHPYDETARPQVVKREENAGLHRLLTAFRDLTGRAALLNTSFNLHGEPIVATAEDAASVLTRSGLRHLVLDRYLVSAGK